MLSLAAGEYAYATIRAIGVGFGAADPADLLQWGVKTVASNATNTNGPLVIRTLNFPSSPAFVALTPVSTPFRTFGGNAADHRRAVCADKFGNTVLNGAGAPAASPVSTGTTTSTRPAGQRCTAPRRGRDGSGNIADQRARPTHPTPHASVPCPPGGHRDRPVHVGDCADGRQHDGARHLHAEVLGRLLLRSPRRRRERAAHSATAK